HRNRSRSCPPSPRTRTEGAADRDRPEPRRHRRPGGPPPPTRQSRGGVVTDQSHRPPPQTTRRPKSLDQIRADVFLALLSGETTYPTHTSGGVRLTIDLPTLMGLAEQAGDLEDWGPVVSDLARQIADSLHGSTWEVAVTDPATRLPIWVGTTRRRP